MKIVISSSMKYRDTVREVISELKSFGHDVLFPNLDYENENKSPINSTEEVKRLATDHYKAINSADCMYMITTNGYMGTSCKLELGYAIAKKIPIYFTEPTNDLALDCYVKDFIPLTALRRFKEI